MTTTLNSQCKAKMADKLPKDATTGEVELDALVFSVVDVLNQHCGFAGLAISPGYAMINTTNPRTKSDYLIKFEIKKPTADEAESSTTEAPSETSGE